MCSVRFSRKPNIHVKREKKQNFMTKPSQYPEKYTRPMRHIHHFTMVWLDPVIDAKSQNPFIPSGHRVQSRNYTKTNADADTLKMCTEHILSAHKCAHLKFSHLDMLILLKYIIVLNVSCAHACADIYYSIYPGQKYSKSPKESALGASRCAEIHKKKSQECRTF